MDNKLKEIVKKYTRQRQLNKVSDERKKKEQAGVSSKEKELLPRKLEMAEDIFCWGRDILANEDYKFVRELGVSDGLALATAPGLRVYSGNWGDDYRFRKPHDGYPHWSRLILTDDGTFYYRKGYKFMTLDGFVIPDPEFLAESFMHRYVSDLHEFTMKGAEKAVSKVTHGYSDEIRWGLEGRNG
jgi:hypothetical protein